MLNQAPIDCPHEERREKREERREKREFSSILYPKNLYPLIADCY
jgi:hypothetical protein